MDDGIKVCKQGLINYYVGYSKLHAIEIKEMADLFEYLQNTDGRRGIEIKVSETKTMMIAKP